MIIFKDCFMGVILKYQLHSPMLTKHTTTCRDLPRGMWTYCHVEFSADDGVVQEADRHAVYPRYERFEADLIVAGGAELNHGGDLVVVDIFDDHCSRKLLTL